MVKKSLLFIFFFFLTFMNNVFAHTGLESSSPEDGEIVKEEFQEISLSFETKVEQGSSFIIISSNGNPIPIENISLDNNNIVGSFQNPLENGTYKVQWNIIGADGHPIDGEYSFSVQVPNNQEQIDREQVQNQPPQKKENNIENNANEQIEQKKLPSFVVPTLIVVLSIIVIGSFVLLIRRKK